LPDAILAAANFGRELQLGSAWAYTVRSKVLAKSTGGYHDLTLTGIS